MNFVLFVSEECEPGTYTSVYSNSHLRHEDKSELYYTNLKALQYAWSLLTLGYSKVIPGELVETL